MKFKFFSLAAIAVLLVNALGVAADDTPRSAAERKRASAKLVSVLPDSDGIVVLESKRFFDEALPRVLSANQPMLTEVTAKLKEMEARTGIDLRKFDQLAVGISMKQVSPTEVDYEAVAVATGAINVDQQIADAKAASKGSFREEKVGTRSIYIFSGKDLAAAHTTRPANSKLAAAMDKVIAGLEKKEVAIAAYDPTTLLIGVPERVRQALGSTAKTDSDVRALLPAAGKAVIAFAARTNGLLGKLLPLEADMLGENLNSIQYMNGTMDVAPAATSLHVMARTKTADQASELKTTLDGLQIVGKAFLGNAKGDDKQVYNRMLQNAKVAVRGTDLTFDLAVPQADIDVLIREKK